MPYKNSKSPEALESLRAARRKHYHANKDAYKARAKAKREDLRAYVRQLKMAPCVDCGQSYHYAAMQFDHVGGIKVESVNALTSGGSMRKLHEEIAKCELVCANCHAVRTFKRLGVEK